MTGRHANPHAAAADRALLALRRAWIGLSRDLGTDREPAARAAFAAALDTAIRVTTPPAPADPDDDYPDDAA